MVQYVGLPTVTAGGIVTSDTFASLPTDVAEGSIRYVTTEDTIYAFDGTVWTEVAGGGGGGGDVTGPVSSTNDALVRWQGTGGDTIKNTAVTASDAELNYTIGVTSAIQTQLDTKITAASTDTLQNKTLDNTNVATLLDTNFTLQDNTTPTKQMKFELSGITSSTTRTVTVPDADLTLVGTATTQTLTNKTLTSPTITNATLSLDDNSSAFTLTVRPDSGFSANRVLTISMDDANRILELTGDVSIGGAFSTTSAVTLAGDVGGSVVTLPATGTLATRAGTETLTNKTLGSTNTITGATAASLTVGGSTVTFPVATTTLAGRDTSDSLTNKSIQGSTNIIAVHDNNFEIRDNSDSTKRFTFDAANVTTSTTRTYSVPDANTTLVGTDATQTLTNKTIDGASNTLTVLAGSQLSGQVPLANGGTAKNMTAVNGGVVWTDADSMEVSAVGVVGQRLKSNGAAAPAFAWQEVISAKSADYTVTDTDGITTILMTTGASARTVTLPTAADNSGRRLTIKKVDSGAGKLTVDGEGGETIDGLTTVEVAFETDTIDIVCDGSNWYYVGQHYQSYSLTGISISGTTACLGTGATCTVAIVRTGRLTTGRITATSGTSPGSTNASTAANGTIPSWARPVAAFYGAAVPTVFSTPEVMYTRIDTAGGITFDVRDLSDGTRNAAAASTTLEPYMFSYPVNT